MGSIRSWDRVGKIISSIHVGPVSLRVAISISYLRWASGGGGPRRREPRIRRNARIHVTAVPIEIETPNVSPARLTLYCGRIYEIRGDGIPPFTYLSDLFQGGRESGGGGVTPAGRRRFNM